jgi:hypothetical protein
MTQKPAVIFAMSILFLSAALAGCSNSGEGDAPADVGPLTDALDATGDGTEGSGDDGSTPDTDGEDATDVSDMEDGQPDVATACETETDCADDEFCIRGRCNDLSCRQPSDWDDCAEWFNEIEADSGRFAVCRDQRCQIACLFDNECADGEVCGDFGRCVVSDAVLGEDPSGLSTGPLRVGVANTLMQFPLGVPLGGYGERAAGNDGRYAVSLRASAGAVHALYARAIALDNDSDQALMIRLPLIFTGDQLHEDVAQALQDATGQDWRDNLIISSTHTHSGPCRHWHLPEDAAAPLGAFGIGEFDQYFYNYVLASTLEAAQEAIANLAPGRVGWTIVESFDTDDQVGRDRWRATPPFDDNRALLMRFEDVDGVPIAAIISFGAHGTDNDSDYASGDMLAGAERALEAELGDEYGRFVPVLYFNQNSGGMSPAGGVRGHHFPQTMERLGGTFVDRVWDGFQSITMSSELTLGTSNLRFELGYDLLGYERDEFAGPGQRPFGGEYHYGGISCSGRQGGDSDPETFDSLEDLVCVGALQFLLNNNPPSTMTKSHIATMSINGLTVTTMPGELTMELSWQVLRALRDEFEVDPAAAWTFGYTNDHLFYLLPTNLRGELPSFPGISTPQAPDDYPDFAFSYLQGGYEASMSPWGPNLGDYLVDRAVESYARMLDADAPTERAEPLPQHLSPRPPTDYDTDVTPDALAGELLVDVPSTVQRFETIEVAWVGGDPAAEPRQIPRVSLMRISEGVEVVRRRSEAEYTNYEPVMMTRTRFNEETSVWEWVVRWEEGATFPRGSYRFDIEGHRFNAAGEAVPYTLSTSEFQLVPTDTLTFSDPVVNSDDGTVSVNVAYPADERMRFLSEADDPGAVSGNFRMRHPMVPTGTGAPIEVLSSVGTQVDVRFGQTSAEFELDRSKVTLTETTQTVNSWSDVPASAITMLVGTPGSTGLEITIDFQDVYGNTGTTTFRVAE